MAESVTSSARVAPRDRIATWAAIAAYIGRDERTARRYETERALPVRRMPGERKSTVYATAADLDDWLAHLPETRSGEAPPASGAGPEAAGRPERRGSPMILGVATAASALALALLAAFVLRPAHAPEPPDAAARSLYQQGVYAWNRRSHDGVAEAIDRFTQAIVRAPGFAAAYAGLADAYDMAPEFGDMSPSDAYPRAKAAAERSVALDPRLASAHRALAFVDFWWAADVRRAKAEFETALRLDPRSSQTLHWYANALAVRGDARALTLIDRAFEIEPSLAVRTDRGFVLMMLGHETEAQSVLTQVVRLDPEYAPPHIYLAGMAKTRGDDEAMLVQERRLAEMKRDPAEAALVDAAAAALASGGREAMLQVVAARREKMYAAGQTTAATLAGAESDLRRRALTLSMLRRARADRDPSMLALDRNSDFAWLRSDPAFRSLTVR